jgi:hypothetical protein
MVPGQLNYKNGRENWLKYHVNTRYHRTCGMILMWFTEAYIKNIFVKLILKIFTLENSNGKGQNILPRPGGWQRKLVEIPCEYTLP